MPKEETIELRHIRNTIGEREDLPSLSPRVSLASRIRALTTKFFGIPQLVHLYGALELNKTLTFAVGENTVRALFLDGTYLYAGFLTYPGKIVKVDLSTFTAVSTLTLAAGDDEVRALVSDGTYLYAGLSVIPGKIVKVELSTFTIVSTLTLTGAGENNIMSLFSDGTYLYAGLNVSPGIIVKIDLSTFTEVGAITFAAGENEVRSTFSDGTYLYAGLNVNPGKIVKVDLSTFTAINTLTLAAGEGNVLSLFSDGTYLYAGLYTTPTKIAKIDLLTFTLVNVITFAAGENDILALFSDGTYLYAGLNVNPGKIVKVDLSTFTAINTITFDAGENGVRALFSDGTYLYAGLSTAPGKLIRKYIIPSNDQHQRKIDITNISVQSTISTSTSLGLTTTLIDTARTEGNDYWNGLTLFILGGACKGQSRLITDFDAASDTITVSPAFTSAIASGVRYAILPGGSGSSTLVQADILNDATPFAGADIATIKDNLTGTVTNGTYSHTNNTNQQDVLIFAAAKQKIDIYLDMTNITQSTTIREFIEVDGATYRQISQKVFPTDFDTNTKAISISVEQPNRDYKVTFQSGTAEGGAKDVPYTYITLPRT